MSLSADSQIDAIRRHSLRLAAAAKANLAEPVTHCPGWSVADLGWHVTEVQWFWATIAKERLSAPPDESRRPSRPPDAEVSVSGRLGGELTLHSGDTGDAWTLSDGGKGLVVERATAPGHRSSLRPPSGCCSGSTGGSTSATTGPGARHALPGALRHRVAAPVNPHRRAQRARWRPQP